MIADEMWQGIWVPIARSFRDMGLDVDEPNFTMASDIGPIPQDGGNYLKFLVVLRDAAEADGMVEHRRASVVALLNDPTWGEEVEALGGTEAVTDRLFPAFVSTVPRMPASTAVAMIDAGYATPDTILSASDVQLRAFDGVGSKLLAALRERANTASEPSAAFVDNLER